MEEVVVGRHDEKKLLGETLLSGEAELIALYGRRRIGKTFLVRNFFANNLLFEFTGVHEATLAQQLQNFSLALQQSMGLKIPPAPPLNWIQAFDYLSRFIEGEIKKQPIVLLFDELPWIHTPKSGFLSAFGHWWNTWASRHPLIKVVICGSAASWMIEHIINNKGGLHNRVSKRIRLLPFSLGETEEYLSARGIKLDRYQLLQLYMATGGIPQYLKQIQSGESAAQAIDRLYFTKNGFLQTEFNNLYSSLFNHSENHEAVVKALAKKPGGMSRTEIISACGFSTGGWTSKLFEELEQSGFISQYIPFNKTSRDSIYKLSDEYSLFYLKFVYKTSISGSGSWLKISAKPSYRSWSGFAFEAVCQKHVAKIRKALGISGVYTEESAWRHIPGKGESGCQVDLLLDRQDHCINLCEIKFSADEFTIEKKYAQELDLKVKIFREQTKTRKTIFLTMITSFGVRQNIYYTGRVVAEVKMDDLFS